MKKIKIKLTKEEINHLKNNPSCYMDNCETIIKICDKIKKKCELINDRVKK